MGPRPGILGIAVFAVALALSVPNVVHASTESAAKAGKRIVAVDGPLSQVLADVGPHFNGEIILVDESMGAHIVSGAYDMDNPAQAMQTIVAPLGGKVTEVTPWMLIISFN